MYVYERLHQLHKLGMRQTNKYASQHFLRKSEHFGHVRNLTQSEKKTITAFRSGNTPQHIIERLMFGGYPRVLSHKPAYVECFHVARVPSHILSNFIFVHMLHTPTHSMQIRTRDSNDTGPIRANTGQTRILIESIQNKHARMKQKVHAASSGPRTSASRCLCAVLYR